MTTRKPKRSPSKKAKNSKKANEGDDDSRKVVEVSPSTKKRVLKIKSRTGEPLNKIVDRTLLWLTCMNTDVQNTIIGHLDRARTPEFIREILLKSARAAEQGEDWPEVSDAIDKVDDAQAHQQGNEHKKGGNDSPPKSA